MVEFQSLTRKVWWNQSKLACILSWLIYFGHCNLSSLHDNKWGFTAAPWTPRFGPILLLQCNPKSKQLLLLNSSSGRILGREKSSLLPQKHTHLFHFFSNTHCLPLPQKHTSLFQRRHKWVCKESIYTGMKEKILGGRWTDTVGLSAELQKLTLVARPQTTALE